MDWTRIGEVLVVVIFTSAGQLLLKFSMRDANTLKGFGELIYHALQTPTIWLGVAIYGISTLLWIRILASYPVSSVYPMVAMGYIIVTLGGVLILGERASIQTWIALMVICAGVLWLASTTINTQQG